MCVLFAKLICTRLAGLSHHLEMHFRCHQGGETPWFMDRHRRTHCFARWHEWAHISIRSSLILQLLNGLYLSQIRSKIGCCIYYASDVAALYTESKSTSVSFIYLFVCFVLYSEKLLEQYWIKHYFPKRIKSHYFSPSTF